jgi:SPP1 family holin
MDRGTLIRTIVLVIALLNQFLTSSGLYEIPGTAEEQTAFLSTVFTLAASTWAWFKNNYVTTKGKRQKEVLKEKGLTNAK